MVKIGTLYDYVIYEKIDKSVPYLFINNEVVGFYQIAINSTLKHRQIKVWPNRTMYDLTTSPYKSLSGYLADYKKIRELINDDTDME